ncbi:MAG: single-stranded DNA-binding protein [Caldilineaceae bacterium]|nr:single-stranded DNA-binding protein [Caldilineaceae bacterium]
MYQQITLVGIIGSEPELRYTPTGTPVCSFRLAVKKEWTGTDGEAHEKATWFRVTAWRKLAEVVSTYLAKGRQVLVIGEMEEAQAYISKSGELAATNAVTAQSIRFLDSPEHESATEEDEVAATASRPAGRQVAPTGSARLAIDIPF